MTTAERAPAESPAPANYGWLRTTEAGNPSYADRVAWHSPGTATGTMKIYCNKNGVGQSGQSFCHAGAVPSLLLVLALAANVSQQMASGVELKDLNFTEPQK